MLSSGGLVTLFFIINIIALATATPAAGSDNSVSFDEDAVEREIPPQFLRRGEIAGTEIYDHRRGVLGSERFKRHHRHSNGIHPPVCRPRSRDNITEILLEHNAQAFCSSLLHISLVPATTTTTATQTVSEVLATLTSTDTTTTDLGTTTVTDTATESDTITTTVTTVTDTETDTETSTLTTTTTTSIIPQAIAQNPRKRDDRLPHYLPFPLSKISSACSQIVQPRTDVSATATVTTTLTDSLTSTITTTSTSSIPQQTATTDITTTETDTISATSTTVTTTTASTTTTQTAVSTQCAEATFGASGIGVGATGEVDFDSSIQSQNDCCVSCFNTLNCGVWLWRPGQGCQIGVNAQGPDPSPQCPSGLGTYLAAESSPTPGFVAGLGPCNGGLSVS